MRSTHRRTDPLCARLAPVRPRTPLGWLRFDRGLGRVCRVCELARALSAATSAVGVTGNVYVARCGSCSWLSAPTGDQTQASTALIEHSRSMHVPERKS